jgi:glycosyltransferase involved in cell wall biosynthesis
MRVSAKIPTYNRAYILPEAADGVLRQAYSNFELIIINDGSTQDTVQLARKFSDPGIQHVQHASQYGCLIVKDLPGVSPQ